MVELAAVALLVNLAFFFGLFFWGRRFFASRAAILLIPSLAFVLTITYPYLAASVPFPASMAALILLALLSALVVNRCEVLAASRTASQQKAALQRTASETVATHSPASTADEGVKVPASVPQESLCNMEKSGDEAKATGEPTNITTVTPETRLLPAPPPTMLPAITAVKRAEIEVPEKEDALPPATTDTPRTEPPVTPAGDSPVVVTNHPSPLSLAPAPATEGKTPGKHPEGEETGTGPILVEKPAFVPAGLTLADYIKEGFRRKEKGDYAGAARCFMDACAITGSSKLRVSLLVELSKIYREAGQKDQAVAILKLLARCADPPDDRRFYTVD